MKARHLLLGCLALAGCDATTQLELAGPVVVSFDQPFPADAPDLLGFLPRDWGRYTDLADTSRVFELSKTSLAARYSVVERLSRAQLDSLRLPGRAWSGLGPDGVHCRVTPLLADSFRLQTQGMSKVIDLAHSPVLKLRYYRGYYYTSTPAYLDSTKWTVRRVAVAHGHIIQQLFNPDSLRVRALDPTTVRQQRGGGQLLITLAPRSRRAIGQVSSYAGLWLDVPTEQHPVVESILAVAQKN